MEVQTFKTARQSLDAAPFSKWLAILASIVSIVAFLLLLPLIYLFVDLLVWRGAVPTYTTLTAARQQDFREDWERTLGQDNAIADNLARIRPIHEEGRADDTTKWEWRWQATVYTTFESRIGTDAANAYIDLSEPRPATAIPTNNRLGVLSLIARERPRWTAILLGHCARLNPWMWHSDTSNEANVRYLAGLFIAAFVLSILFLSTMFVAEHGAAVATLESATGLRRSVFTHANRLSQLAVRKQAALEAANLFTQRIDVVQDGLRAWLLTGIKSPIAIVLLLVTLLMINFWLAACLLLLGAIVWLAGGQFAAWFRRDGRIATRRSEARMMQMKESLSIIQLVKCYLMERFNQNRVERQISDHTKAEWRRLRGDALSQPAFISAVTIAGIIAMYLAGRSVLAGDMSVAGMAMKLAAVTGLVWALSSWISARVRIRRAVVAYDEVAEFLDRRAEAGQTIDAEFLQPMADRLDFVEVSLRESGTGRMLLEKVTLSVPAGSRVVVVGSDPDETASLVHLLARFLDPTGGEVRIDGKNIRWVTHESLRTQVAMVLQESLVFGDTIANNIGCGDTSFSVPQIIEAAKLAHAHQFIQRLGYGYETLIGDAGHSLRPGEKLRIGLARAILRDPSMLVIEEPDLPMDEDSRALLDDSYERIQHGRTILFLSRRESLLKRAAKVVVLHKGRIAAAGTHDDLMHSSELYRHLLFKEMTVPSPSVS